MTADNPTIQFIHQTAAAAATGFIGGALWRINPFIGTAMAVAGYLAVQITGPFFSEVNLPKAEWDVKISGHAVQVLCATGLSCIIEHFVRNFRPDITSRHVFTIVPLALIAGEYVRHLQSPPED